MRVALRLQCRDSGSTTECCLNEVVHDLDVVGAVLSGEFVGESYVKIFEIAPAVPKWTIMRNPIDRALAQLDWLAQNHPKFYSHVWVKNEVFSRPLCGNRHQEACDMLVNPKKCEAGGVLDPCGLFQSHITRVLGGLPSSNASEDRPDVLDNLGVAMRRVDEGTLHVGIYEYFDVSMCLLLHENFPSSRRAAKLFETCCHQRTKDCPFAFGTNAMVGNRSRDNLHIYSTKKVLKLVFRSNAEDCILYEQALRTFVRRVQAMEEERGIKLLEPHIDNFWSCHALLDRFLTSGPVV